MFDGEAYEIMGQCSNVSGAAAYRRAFYLSYRKMGMTDAQAIVEIFEDQNIGPNVASFIVQQIHAEPLDMSDQDFNDAVLLTCTTRGLEALQQ
jgi:hypothetical protein